jgi:RNA polymerase sigma factor (sigma-70 family)
MSALREAQPAPTCSEHALISAVRRGDDRAFEELYARYRPRIASYVLGMVGDHQRAEDIAQEVFIAALRRLRATERPIAFKPWIYEIAKNACIDDFRRARRTREVSLGTDTETAPPARLIAHGADTAVEHKQQLDDLRGAFSGLSESHHRIIVMRELEGRSYSQIGESLGMSKPVVESTLFRARRKLSEEYEELVTGRRCERVQTLITTDGDRPLRRLGIKERRLLARHLAHCQSCRRHARVAGIDESFFKTPSVAARIAALLPLPWLRLRRRHGGGGSAAASGGSGRHSVEAVQSLQNAAVYADPSGPAASLSRAVAAAAAIVVAGAGGGLVTGLSHHGRMPAPRVVNGAPARAASHTAATSMSRSARTPAIPPALPGAKTSSAGSGTTHRARHRSGRVGGSSSGGGSGQSSTSHGTGSAGGSSGSATLSHSGTGSGSAPSASSVTSGASSAVHNPLAAAAGTASKLLGGGSSSGSSGSGIQLPKVGPVQLPKIPLNLPKLPSGTSSTTTSSSSSSPPTVPGLPDPNKLLSSLTGH